MNFSSIRVAVIYRETRKLIFYDYGLGEQQLIQQALLEFGLNPDHVKQFELILQALDYKIKNSQELAMNDILVLKPKTELFKEEEAIYGTAPNSQKIYATSSERDINKNSFNKTNSSTY